MSQVRPCLQLRQELFRKGQFVFQYWQSNHGPELYPWRGLTSTNDSSSVQPALFGPTPVRLPAPYPSASSGRIFTNALGANVSHLGRVDGYSWVSVGAA